MGAGTGLEEKGTVDLKTKYVAFKVFRYDQNFRVLSVLTKPTT
jgi:hypothetical protein